ncbi:hypothetical protein COEREDRAFT_10546 [Coemansia reversa NRRL 1564]|uniref:Uncharacterized protein n=1 Tax=Coemansia reversa (strain ATCC 12441 / NRRL 1564) TaxID=763665 RepID=A0A2G5B5A7_COERN|nr:hypothetical protein COEREDRAFT_10546 [Coemansia reversa NRRL 1564]|eukprot:PIA14182.1 hypothetical protein COEREDRAFT_10546 [Coemansia reversa NRRL 1564]
MRDAASYDDVETFTSTLLSRYIASLELWPVAVRKVSLISVCYSGACVDSDSDILSDAEVSRNSAEYALIDKSDGEIAAGTAQSGIKTEEYQMVNLGGAVCGIIFSAMETSSTADYNHTYGALAQVLLPMALACHTDVSGAAEYFALNSAHASSLNRADQEKVLSTEDHQIKLESSLVMAVGDEFINTEYLEPEEQLQHMPKLHSGNVDISTEGSVIVDFDDELQPGLGIGISCDLVLGTATVPGWPWKWIAPLLVTAKLLEAPSGNIVDQHSSAKPDDNVGLSAPSLDISEAHKRVE